MSVFICVHPRSSVDNFKLYESAKHAKDAKKKLFFPQIDADKGKNKNQTKITVISTQERSFLPPYRISHKKLFEMTTHLMTGLMFLTFACFAD